MTNKNGGISNNQHKYAGFGRRFLAYWVDGLLLFPLGLFAQYMLGIDPFAVLEAESLAQLEQLQQSSQMNMSSAVGLLIGFIFYIIMWVNFDGATPGKKLMAIKIIKNDNSPISYPVALVRYIGYFISGFVAMLGFLWIIGDKKKQGWHDKIAGTVVVQTKEKPRTLLAVILTILAMIITFGYVGLTIAQTTMLTLDSVKNTDVSKIPSQSLEKNRDNMSAEARVHYDKSQTFFQQMQAVRSNPEAIKPLADQAVAEAKLATELEPNNPFLWSNLADAYSWPNNIGTAEDSLNAYKKAEELDPNNVVYINFVGDQLIAMKRYEEAVLQFQKTLRLSKNSGYAHLSLGRAYKGLNIIDEARTHFTEAIRIFKAENKTGSYDDEILQAQKEMGSLPANN